jgi:hypothetical protein
LGLYIPFASKGPVLLDHVYASENSGELGIVIQTSAGGAVTLNTVEAIGNRRGISIDNCWGSPCTTTAGAVSLTALSLHNTFGNLTVFANGAITGNTITSEWASDPSSHGGIDLQNHNAKSVRAITLSNVTSRYNNVYGLNLQSRGAVTLNHVESYSNNNSTTTGIQIITPGAVSILSTLGSNRADNNNGDIRRGIHQQPGRLWQ